jgi:hypothetical protein
MDDTLDFLSEPTTEEDAKLASGEREDAPDGQYKMVARRMLARGIDTGKPRLEVNFSHAGRDGRRYKNARFAIFGKDKLAELAAACGFAKEELEGLRWGVSEETDQWGNHLAFVQDKSGSVITERFLGKRLVANIKTRQTDSGEFTGINYVKAETE